MSFCIPRSSLTLYDQVCDWSNLLLAWRKAAKGKRSGDPAASFEYLLADNLLMLQTELLTEDYQPDGYSHFYIHEPKRRLISAAPFRDRVVHHALCNIVEPLFEKHFISDSYANRVGKGTHLAIDRFQYFARRYDYVLRLDIVKHFPSMDHEILFQLLSNVIKGNDIQNLIAKIIDSGKGVHEQEYSPVLFPGDDLLALCRPTGLPIGNLTSQFWSNCYLHPLDLFIKRELSCHAYLRYVDDFALFSNSKTQLWDWKLAVREKLQSLRLRFHENSAQVSTVISGVPWLGFVVFPSYRRLKKRKIIHASRHLNEKYNSWQQGLISFGEFDASVQGWINHVRYADSWGLRKHILRPFELKKSPGANAPDQ